MTILGFVFFVILFEISYSVIQDCNPICSNTGSCSDTRICSDNTTFNVICEEKNACSNGYFIARNVTTVNIDCSINSEACMGSRFEIISDNDNLQVTINCGNQESCQSAVIIIGTNSNEMNYILCTAKNSCDDMNIIIYSKENDNIGRGSLNVRCTNTNSPCSGLIVDALLANSAQVIGEPMALYGIEVYCPLYTFNCSVLGWWGSENSEMHVYTINGLINIETTIASSKSYHCNFEFWGTKVNGQPNEITYYDELYCIDNETINTQIISAINNNVVSLLYSNHYNDAINCDDTKDCYVYVSKGPSNINEIYCPNGDYKCVIVCLVQNACENVYIYGNNSKSLKVHVGVEAKRACENCTIICPQGTGTFCQININAVYGNHNGMIVAENTKQVEVFSYIEKPNTHLFEDSVIQATNVDSLYINCPSTQSSCQNMEIQMYGSNLNSSEYPSNLYIQCLGSGGSCSAKLFTNGAEFCDFTIMDSTWKCNGININRATLVPTQNPTISTKTPSLSPTIPPTKIPSQTPSTAPTKMPTKISQNPTSFPSSIPTQLPSMNPFQFTQKPSIYPTHLPTTIPTINPTTNPTVNPTTIPTTIPTTNPTTTQFPSISPTNGDETTSNGLSKSIWIPSIIAAAVVCIGLLVCMIFCGIHNRTKSSRNRKGTSTSTQMVLSQPTNSGQSAIIGSNSIQNEPNLQIVSSDEGYSPNNRTTIDNVINNLNPMKSLTPIQKVYSKSIETKGGNPVYNHRVISPNEDNDREPTVITIGSDNENKRKPKKVITIGDNNENNRNVITIRDGPSNTIDDSDINVSLPPNESILSSDNDEIIAKNYQQNQNDLENLTQGYIKAKKWNTKKGDEIILHHRSISSQIQSDNDEIIAKNQQQNYNDIQYLSKGYIKPHDFPTKSGNINDDITSDDEVIMNHPMSDISSQKSKSIN